MDDVLFSACASRLAFLFPGSTLWLKSQAKRFFLYWSTLQISGFWGSGQLAIAHEEPLVNCTWYLNSPCSTLLPVVEPCRRMQSPWASPSFSLSSLRHYFEIYPHDWLWNMTAICQSDELSTSFITMDWKAFPRILVKAIVWIFLQWFFFSEHSLYMLWGFSIGS